MPTNGRGLPWSLFWAELVGTFSLVAVGGSLVILAFGTGSPVAHWLPDPLARRALTGFLFGATGTLTALSWVGRTSGAHINPVITLAFWLLGRLDGRHVPGYVLAQLAGGALGGVPLLLWGKMGKSVQYAATLPGPAGPWVAVLGEAACTFLLVTGLFLFLDQPYLRPYTPFLYAFLVALEAPLSGTSTNPARSLGPALVSGAWRGYWVYWLGPLLGLTLGVGFAHRLPRVETGVAKLYHFQHDPHGVFRRRNPPAGRKPDR